MAKVKGYENLHIIKLGTKFVTAEKVKLNNLPGASYALLPNTLEFVSREAGFRYWESKKVGKA